MPAPIAIKIDVTKLRKEWFFRGKSGIYADVILYANDEPDQYGNTHSLKQSPSKEAREQGEKGHYVGNGTVIQRRPNPAAAKSDPAPSKSSLEEQDDIPF